MTSSEGEVLRAAVNRFAEVVAELSVDAGGVPEQRAVRDALERLVLAANRVMAPEAPRVHDDPDPSR